jgi:DNA-binding MarR family transcriptional regulator
VEAKMSFAISIKLGQLLDQALFSINDATNMSRAHAALDDVVSHVGALREQLPCAAATDTSFQLGAAELLQSMLVRVIERREGNRALTLVRRRKYVLDILHMLAKSFTPILPSEIAARLGAQQSAIAALLKEMQKLGLVARADNGADGRNRPRLITSSGRIALTEVKPDWAISTPKRKPTREVSPMLVNKVLHKEARKPQRLFTHHLESTGNYKRIWEHAVGDVPGVHLIQWTEQPRGGGTLDTDFSTQLRELVAQKSRTTHAR